MTRTANDRTEHFANQAIRLVGRGSLAERERFEDAHGAPLSIIIDNLAADAADAGQEALAARLDRAYTRLTA